MDGPEGTLAVVHPGAASPDRRWPAGCFAETADALCRAGMNVALTGGWEETDLVGEVASRMQTRALDLSGQTTLGVLGALLSEAAVVVCNDTGVSHLAAAVGKPSVVIGRSSQKLRWAPMDTARHIYLEHEPGGGSSVRPEEVAALAVKQAETRQTTAAVA